MGTLVSLWPWIRLDWQDVLLVFAISFAGHIAVNHVCEGENCYENTAARLRAKGYQLIDLDPREATFTAVWYRKTRSWLGLRISEHAAMLVWESTDDGEQTTLHRWQL